MYAASDDRKDIKFIRTPTTIFYKDVVRSCIRVVSLF